MKKTTSFILFIFFYSLSFGSTVITSSSVFGHWTLSGSPYVIFNDVYVQSSNTLLIDPGVNIIFQGPYRLNVYGKLSAIGSATNPINFTVNDTSGWYTNNSSAIGGWHGIQFQSFAGSTADISTLKFCNISFTKFDSLDFYTTPQLSTLFTNRNLNIQNCNFINNKVNLNSNVPMFSINDVGTIIHSSFHDNIGGPASMLTINAKSNLIDNKFYNDSSFGAIINIFDSSFVSNNVISSNHSYGSVVNIYAPSSFKGNNINCNVGSQNIIGVFMVDFLFEGNHHLDSSKIVSALGNCSPLNLFRCPHAIVKNNRISHNISYNDAALNCDGGFIDINSNVITNNAHTNGFCGYSDGGGGIKLGCNGCITDSCAFTVRNNVIANNFSPFRGGAIYATNAKLTVTNNQIVNNKSGAGGGIFLYTYGYGLVFKNNIFYGNVTPPNTALTTPAIEGNSFGLIEFNNNWSQHSGLFDLGIYSGYTLSGSAAENIVGISPGFISPTVAADFMENAITANFQLRPSSFCINKGDNSAHLDTLDCLGAARIAGSHVDIGAYEFHNFCLDTVVGSDAICISSSELLTFPYSGGTWRSLQPSIIYIDSSLGMITGIAPGIATIAYATTTCLALKDIVVDTFITPVVISGIDNVCVGSTVILTPTIFGGVWTSANSNGSVSDGLVTGLNKGYDTISYAISGLCNSVHSSKIILIDSIPVVGNVTGPSIVCPGAIIHLSDTTIGGVWTVSNASSAITGAGVVTGIIPGSDTVYYTKSNACGSAHSSHPINVLTFDECRTHTASTDLFATITDNKAMLYPNPTNSELNISCTEKIESISIINPEGAIVDFITCNADNICIDISYFKPGIYFIVLNNAYKIRFTKI